ncbi:MAG: hemin uptake protein HemP [Gemmatales bacterium]|nr:hemin uptake protein HemP [Gemmatales bacterium]MDW8385959.1 hemin uptake protein HemP [Gemmatales bacterium]
MTEKRHESPSASSPVPSSASAEPVPVMTSQQIFRGQREIVIEHAGVRYRLRITRRNKLILQK